MMLRLEKLNVIFTSPAPCTNKHEGEHDDQDKGARWQDDQGEQDDKKTKGSKTTKVWVGAHLQKNVNEDV